MLESVFFTLNIVSFLCLILSVIIGNKDSTKLISKILLSGVAMAIFSVLAISSVNIEIAYCSATTCDTKALFYGHEGYIFWTMGLISAFIMFAYTILLILNIYKPGVFGDKKELNEM